MEPFTQVPKGIAFVADAGNEQLLTVVALQPIVAQELFVSTHVPVALHMAWHEPVMPLTHVPGVGPPPYVPDGSTQAPTVPAGQVAAPGLTYTVTDCAGDVPPAPVHWNVNVVVVVIGFVRPDPDNKPPLLHGPPAVQDVAFVELQVRVALVPVVTVAEELPFTNSEAVGAGVGGTMVKLSYAVAVPPGPVAVQTQLYAPCHPAARI